MSTISAGTTSTTTLIATGDTTGSLVLKTNDTGSGGTTAMTIDTSQNVGIGTSSPGTYGGLVVQAASGVGAPLTLLTTDAGTNAQTVFKGSRQYQIGTGNASSGFAGSLFFYDGTAGATRMLIDSSGNLQFNSGYGSVATAYGCRAWVNFNGTGTVAIRASGNVSSITDNGTGDYTVNFTTAMPDANYSFNGATQWAAGGEGDVVMYNTSTTLTASAIRIIVGVPGTAGSTALTPSDRASVFVQIFR